MRRKPAFGRFWVDLWVGKVRSSVETVLSHDVRGLSYWFAEWRDRIGFGGSLEKNRLVRRGFCLGVESFPLREKDSRMSGVGHESSRGGLW